jgi:hypothetical protein
MAKRRQSKPVIDESTRSTNRRPPRPQFFRWWTKNRSRFLIDLQWGPPEREQMQFSFEGIHPALHGVVSDGNVSVKVHHAEEFWDRIFDVDVKPKRVRRGYICEWCTEWGPPRPFPNRSALLANHLYEPLLEWVNEQLAPAHWLVLRTIPGMTEAEITIEPPTAKPDPKRKWVSHLISLRSPFNERSFNEKLVT